jgi:urease accessory protein
MPFDPVPCQLQRARGRAEVGVSVRAGRVRLDRLFQSGCAKALLPRTDGAAPEAVLVNTAGGVAGGDRLAWRLAAGPGAALVATTQAAERIYRSTGATAAVETRLAVGAGARIDWLPQETILFDGARLDRRLEADLAGDATLTALEMLVLGRAAMGERVRTAALADHWRLRRDGRLVHAEALRLDGDIGAATAGAATLGGARALATLLHAAPSAEHRLDEARARLAPRDGVAAAATAKAGCLILRFLAADGLALRRALGDFLRAFRPQPLPRVWSS